MTNRHLEDSEDGTMCMPTNILPNVPVIMCWDDNDFNEETISCHGTIHCTNGIIIQKGGQQAAPVLQTSSMKRKHKRSFTPMPCKTLPYNAGKRYGPGRNDHEERANTRQLVPGWSGFNSIISTDIPALCIVGYCSVIEASPTELSTV